MGGGDDGLGLELSLRLGVGVEARDLNPMQRTSQRSLQASRHKSAWSEIVHLSHLSSDGRPFPRGIDVNLEPTTADCEDENGVSSPNSTISSTSGKRSEREAPLGEETEAERASCSPGSDEEDGDGDGGGGENSRKKLRLTKEQSLLLEETFKEHNTLNSKQKLALSKQLNLRPRQVEVWFQNRRARTKLKQTEVDCEYLRRCCENLTEENKRLQKEVQELRALKLSPQLYMHMSPPTTLTMCPQCQRVAISSSSSSAVSGNSAAAAPTGTGSNCRPLRPSIQRPIPMNPWASLPVQYQPSNVPRS